MKWPKCGKVWTKLGTEELKEAAMTALEITLDTRFDDTGHVEQWRNRLAQDLNYLIWHAEACNLALQRIILSTVARVAQFEEIQVKRD